jgi:hypothetical protein
VRGRNHRPFDIGCKQVCVVDNGDDVETERGRKVDVAVESPIPTSAAIANGLIGEPSGHYQDRRGYSILLNRSIVLVGSPGRLFTIGQHQPRQLTHCEGFNPSVSNGVRS